MAKSGRTIISDFDLQKPSVKIGYRACYLAAIGMVLIMFYPLLWVFFGSLKEPKEIYGIPQTLLPHFYHWNNFVTAWGAFNFPLTIKNTFILFAGTLFFKFLVTCMAAYALSHIYVPFRKVFFVIFLATLMVPPVSYMIPSYLVLQHLPLVNWNVLDSYWAFWLPAGTDAFTLVLMKGFFDGLPKSLFEAARIDGASELKILYRIVLPLSKPILAVLTIFTFLNTWNEFLWPRIVLPSPEKWTIAIALYHYSFISQLLTPNIKLAGMLISAFPPIIIFLIFQRYIIEGVTFAGIKG